MSYINFTDETFKKIVSEEKTLSGVLRRLDKSVTRSGYDMCKKKIQTMGLDISHFTEKRENSFVRKYSNDPVVLFVSDSNVPRSTIKSKIIKDKLIPYHCDSCKISEWYGKKLSLVLDHINGINNDNRLNNLRFLCPNCNSQTDTFCGRNKKIKSTSNQNTCVDCLTPISYGSKRCKSCATKYNYKTGILKVDKKIFRCIDCDKIITYGRTRCGSCACKFRYKNFGQSLFTKSGNGKIPSEMKESRSLNRNE